MKACLPFSSIRLTVTNVKIDHRGLIPSRQNSLSVSVRHLQVQELMGSSCSEDLAGELSYFYTPDWRLSPSLFGEVVLFSKALEALGGTHPLLATLGKSALAGLGQLRWPLHLIGSLTLKIKPTLNEYMVHSHSQTKPVLFSEGMNHYNARKRVSLEESKKKYPEKKNDNSVR